MKPNNFIVMKLEDGARIAFTHNDTVIADMKLTIDEIVHLAKGLIDCLHSEIQPQSATSVSHFEGDESNG